MKHDKYLEYLESTLELLELALKNTDKNGNGVVIFRYGQNSG